MLAAGHGGMTQAFADIMQGHLENQSNEFEAADLQLI